MTAPVTSTARLYIIATPIGNLKDITYRAVETLGTVFLIAAEDTRHTKILLNHYAIKTPVLSYYEHNRFTRIPQILEHLREGRSVAVVTDAGTPGISDPAYRLIRSAIEADIPVEAIPGASAFLTALVSSGLPTDSFKFVGFLPPKKGRMGKLRDLADNTETLVFYESPHRILKTLQDIHDTIGNRPAVIGRELTKIHEEIRRGTVRDLIQIYTKKKPLGEFVLIIGKDDANVYFK
ncbi:MAG: 16S rRNA (cytidine(1402)-2'-O)-methyltransferase [Candidatus Neomarinimicrobiota bacterium]